MGDTRDTEASMYNDCISFINFVLNIHGPVLSSHIGMTAGSRCGVVDMESEDGLDGCSVAIQLS